MSNEELQGFGAVMFALTIVWGSMGLAVCLAWLWIKIKER